MTTRRPGAAQGWALAAVAAASIAVGLAAGAALAQGSCLQPDEMGRRLLDLYGERPYLAMLSSSGAVWQIFVNPATETWTAVARRPSGAACVVGSGRGVFALPGHKTDEEGRDGA